MKMIAIAGFGDDGSMFAPLLSTKLAAQVDLAPLDLPGFGAPPFSDRKTTLGELAAFVDEKARELKATVLLAHSVASIIATLAAQRPGSSISAIISLEGNLVPEDTYFSGTAADFDNPNDFNTAFLTRLHEMAKDHPGVARYKAMVETADSKALWELGCDANSYSNSYVPGKELLKAAAAVYLYNPENISPAGRAWLAQNELRSIALPGASHWLSIAEPDRCADAIIGALEALSGEE